MILVWESKGAKQSNTLILGRGETVANYDGASDEGVDTRFEDLGGASPGGRARRFRKLNRSHRFDFERVQRELHDGFSSRMSFLGKTKESERKFVNPAKSEQWSGERKRKRKILNWQLRFVQKGKFPGKRNWTTEAHGSKAHYLSCGFGVRYIIMGVVLVFDGCHHSFEIQLYISQTCALILMKI